VRGEKMKPIELHRAPGRRAWKTGKKLKRGAALQIMTYPRAGAKRILVETARNLGISLSSLLVGSGLVVAAKLAGCSVTDLVPRAELGLYGRGHSSDRIGVELWEDRFTANGPEVAAADPRTQGEIMRKTDSILELEDRAQKLQALASLLKDPSLDDVVSKLFGDTPILRATAIPARYRNPHSSTATLTEAIRGIASELPQPFTATDAVRQLKERQFVFRRPALDAVRDALYRLTHGKSRALRIVQEGKAGKPNRYALIS